MNFTTVFEGWDAYIFAAALILAFLIAWLTR